MNMQFYKMTPNTELSFYNFNPTMIERTHLQRRKVNLEFLTLRLNWQKKVETQKKLKLLNMISKLLNTKQINNK